MILDAEPRAVTMSGWLGLEEATTLHIRATPLLINNGLPAGTRISPDSKALLQNRTAKQTSLLPRSFTQFLLVRNPTKHFGAVQTPIIDVLVPHLLLSILPTPLIST